MSPRHRVLIVEDEPTLRLALRRILEEAGAEVVAVECVTDAFAQLVPDAGITMVLSDLHLPDGLGTAVLERARGLGIARRALSSGDRAALREVDAELATDLLTKPVSRTVLEALVGAISRSGTALRRPDLGNRSGDGEG
ncbi:response regulator [Sandaracinus amylolyticus]|uniref:response regulator n=1 Tax=Sandaracinus amylolyticus TaxID=927083 RepID=UPI00069EA077|nr:response regulator [Sandaracinus amylolyticus]